MNFETIRKKPASNIEIVPSKVGYVTVRNHRLGLERTYRLTDAGEALFVSRSGTNAGVTKNNLESMDALAREYFKKEAQDAKSKKAA